MELFKTKEKYFLHFETTHATFYRVTCKQIEVIGEDNLFCIDNIHINNLAKNISATVDKFSTYFPDFNNENTRLIATGLIQKLTTDQQIDLQIRIYVICGLFLNIVSRDLEEFYLKISQKKSPHPNIIDGLITQEFRKVVICGSFQEHLKDIGDIMELLQAKGVEILSPWTTKVRPETLGTDFILLEGQELINKRDSWRHKYEHMNKFKKSDAIIVCNPMGSIGKGTMFEFGFITCIGKRIIFINPPKELSISFPYEIGLNIFE